VGTTYWIHRSLEMGSQWGRHLNGDAVICGLIMIGLRHSGDAILYLIVTGGLDLNGDVISMGMPSCDHEGAVSQ